jgi:adenylate cyclase
MRLPPWARRILQGLAVGTAGALLAVGLWLLGALDLFEFKTWDMREQLFARSGAATDRIVTILLDQASLDWMKTENSLGFPWPRETHGAIADFCARAGAKALVFDIFYTEPSSYGVSDDESFNASIRENGAVVGGMFIGRSVATQKSWPPDLRDAGISLQGLPEWIAAVKPAALDFPFANFPIEPLASSFRVLGDTNPFMDADNVYRRLALFGRFDGRVVPALGLAAYLAGNPGAHSFSIKPGILEVDGKAVPIDSEGRAILRFRGPTMTHTTYPADAIIQSELQIRNGETPNIDPAVLKGKYVFFGYSAPGLFDLRNSPMRNAYPGVEVHVTLLDNLLSGDFLKSPPLWATILMIVVVCMAAAVTVSSVSRAWYNAVVYIVFIPLIPALGIAAYALGYWVQIVAGTLGTAVSLIGSSILNYATEGKQKRYLKGAFKQYLSPVVIEQLIAHPERLKLGGERRELSIFFSDLQGFTSLSEMLSPEELTALLNEYLSAMTDIIQAEGGTIDKYEGDAIIAFWNAPLEQEDHAVRAIRAALSCQAELARLRPGFKARVNKDLFMRIGMNSGPAVVGNMGSRTRFDYTMLGDAVNLAARLEGINKQFRTYTMVSATTLELTKGAFPARELSRVAVVGRKEPVTVYEPMLQEEYAARKPALEAFDRGLRLFYAGKFGEAARIFEGNASADPASAAYAEKCRELLKSPPEGAWNGVWVMTSK